MMGLRPGLGKIALALAGLWMLAPVPAAQAQLSQFLGQSFAPSSGDEARPVPPGNIPNLPPAGIPGPAANVPMPAIPAPVISSPPPVSSQPAAPPQQGSGGAGQGVLALSARFGKDLPQINGGLRWRIFAEKPDEAGAMRMVKEETTATPNIVLPPGNYVVHLAFGLASAMKAVTLRADTVRETFDVPAGGLRIEGRVGNTPIPPGQLSFDLYKGSQFEAGDKKSLTPDITAGSVVLLPEGTYTIVSNYGDANSVVRSDIRVQAGKLTDVTVTHRAAVITLKLVTATGGEALANTAWSVLSPGGDTIKESIGAFPRFILAEGEYRAIARNEGKIFEREFKVVTGVDGEVEVTAR